MSAHPTASIGEALARERGEPPDSRYLIINCDDLGSSHSANVASLKAVETGVATSATLMVACPWAREAADMFQGRDVGVHLTLTAEYPGYRWRSLTGGRSLHDADGFLPATTEAALAHATEPELRGECRAQIEQALAWGVDVTHLDGHMGVVNLREDFLETLIELAAEYRLPVRLLDEWNHKRLSLNSHARARRRDLAFPDRFVFVWPCDTKALLSERVPALAPGITEFCAHPVAEGAELRGYDKQHADQRARDALQLIDEELKALIARSGARPISYRPLRELQRGGARPAKH